MSTKLATGAPYALGLGKGKGLLACASLAEASALYRAICEKHLETGKRASQMEDGLVYAISGGEPKPIAYVSWNGRVWPGTNPRGWRPTTVALFDPSAPTQEGGAR